jgi:tripartite motif-containing protein 71
VIATLGSDLGEVDGPSGLAVDAAGNLYVADTGNNRVQKYTPHP